MTKKVLIAFAALLLLLPTVGFGLDLTAIDRVRDKGVLDDGDFAVIERFVSDSVGQLVGTEDFSGVGQVRSAIVSRASSSRESAQAQYREQFWSAIQTQVRQGMEQVSEMSGRRGYLGMTNLLILISELGDARLARTAIEGLDNDSAMVRFWAVRAITTPEMLEQLNSTRNAQLASQLARRMVEAADEASADTLELMARYGATINVPQGLELLFAVADSRIARYERWEADRPMADTAILKSLDGAADDSEQGQVAAERFAQLLSYVMQSYINGRGYYDSQRLGQMASVLAEIENSVISQRTELVQSVIRRAIEDDDMAALSQEHDRLLGDGEQAGRLQEAMGFSYSGSNARSPRTLPAQPGS